MQQNKDAVISGIKDIANIPFTSLGQLTPDMPPSLEDAGSILYEEAESLTRLIEQEGLNYDSLKAILHSLGSDKEKREQYMKEGEKGFVILFRHVFDRDPNKTELRGFRSIFSNGNLSDPFGEIVLPLFTLRQANRIKLNELLGQTGINESGLGIEFYESKGGNMENLYNLRGQEDGRIIWSTNKLHLKRNVLYRLATLGLDI